MVRSGNEILYGFDRAASEEFNVCISDLELEDLSTRGVWFSWSNKRGGLGIIKASWIGSWLILAGLMFFPILKLFF